MNGRRPSRNRVEGAGAIGHFAPKKDALAEARLALLSTMRCDANEA
jgi:hypothetical protein